MYHWGLWLRVVVGNLKSLGKLNIRELLIYTLKDDCNFSKQNSPENHELRGLLMLSVS
jgi:hypothetical protein